MAGALENLDKTTDKDGVARLKRVIYFNDRSPQYQGYLVHVSTFGCSNSVNKFLPFMIALRD